MTAAKNVASFQATVKPLAIVVPIKSPDEAKSRLSQVLSPEQRIGLVKTLMSHTLDCLQELAGMADVHVVSSSTMVLREARNRGFAGHPEPVGAGLNGAIAFSVEEAMRRGSTELLVVPIDLPRLSSGSLRRLVEDSRAHWDVVIVSDAVEDGTNILWWRPLHTARFFYGPGSAQRHASYARECGLRVCLTQDACLSFDLDTAEDLARLPTGFHGPAVL